MGNNNNNKNISKMNVKEIIEAIKIGFDKPKLYKRSVWNKTVKVMEFLSDNTGEIERTHFGSGLEKYVSKVEVNDEQLALWALQYKRSLGLPLYVEEVIPELECIARELGCEMNDGTVLTEYFKRHPEDKK